MGGEGLVKSYGPMAQYKAVRCPECGLPAKAVSDQRGKSYRVPRHDIGDNIGRVTRIMCSGGRI